MAINNPILYKNWSSICFIEELDELFEIYFVIRFDTCDLDHGCLVIINLTIDFFFCNLVSEYFKNFFEIWLVYIPFPMWLDFDLLVAIKHGKSIY